jgi:hypothetical protein
LVKSSPIASVPDTSRTESDGFQIKSRNCFDKSGSAAPSAVPLRSAFVTYAIFSAPSELQKNETFASRLSSCVRAGLDSSLPTIF